MFNRFKFLSKSHLLFVLSFNKIQSFRVVQAYCLMQILKFQYNITSKLTTYLLKKRPQLPTLISKAYKSFNYMYING